MATPVRTSKDMPWQESSQCQEFVTREDGTWTDSWTYMREQSEERLRASLGDAAYERIMATMKQHPYIKAIQLEFRPWYVKWPVKVFRFLAGLLLPRTIKGKNRNGG